MLEPECTCHAPYNSTGHLAAKSALTAVGTFLVAAVIGKIYNRIVMDANDNNENTNH